MRTKSSRMNWLSFIATLTLGLFIFNYVEAFSMSKETTNEKNVNRGLLPDSDDQVCFEELGCFNRSEPSSDWIVPDVVTSLLPESPEKIAPTFKAFSCESSRNPAVFLYNANHSEIEKRLSDRKFDPQRRIIFLTHGYTDFFSELNWMGDLKDSILAQKPCQFNVIAVDWNNGTEQLHYFQSVANTRVVGASIALVINKLIQLYPGMTPDNFTIIGHSLGAHIVGFAGKHFQGEVKIRNIIGLDPAGPAFSAVSSASRLDHSDAALVITISTNGGPRPLDSFGIGEPLGHYNFYPNGGETQPGCEPIKAVSNVLLDGLQGISDAFFCSHRRAQRLIAYDERRFTSCQSMAFNCSSYDQFEKGECGQCLEGSDQCAPFGQWFTYWQSKHGPSDNWTEPIRYFVDTEESLPYSLYHYQIKVTTKEDFKSIKGTLKLTLNGEIRDDYQETLQLEDTFEPNQEYTLLYKVAKNLGPIGNINVDWKATLLGDIGDSIGVIDSERINIDQIETRYMSRGDQKQRDNLSTKLNGDDSESYPKLFTRE